MWGLKWHFMNRSVTVALYNIKVTVCHTAGHCGEEYDDWNSDVFRSRLNCSSDVRTNKRQKSIPHSSSSYQKGSITQHGALCGRYNQRQRWSTPKTPTWTHVGSQVECLSEVWWHRADMREHITGTEFSRELSASVVHRGVELCALISSLRTQDKRQHWRQTAAVLTVVRKCPRELIIIIIIINEFHRDTSLNKTLGPLSFVTTSAWTYSKTRFDDCSDVSVHM